MKTIAFDIMADSEESYWWYRARREILCDMIGRLVPPGSNVVDFGAGTGGTSVALAERGYNVLAADVSEAALEACEQRGIATVDLNAKCLREACQDCVLAGDVLEHVGDDMELLASLGRLLRPGGFLVLTVPAYEFLWSGEDYISDHLRRYTRTRLERRLRLAGFEILRCSYFNTLLLPAIAGTILTKRLLFPREMYRSDITPLCRWQNDLLYRIFSFEGILLRWVSFPAGASLLAVARFNGAGRSVA